MSIADLLAARRGGPDVSYQPRIYDLSQPRDAAELEPLLPSLTVVDTIEDQLGELVAARDPAATLDAAERRTRVARLLDGRSPHEYGRWVHYPWSGRLVHLLPPAEFDELRGDRNRYKQLPSERALLKGKTISVAGLSVGQAAVLTLALEGIGGRFRLADFDALALSNLNRLRAGVHELSLNKALITARALYELDPYLELQLFLDGVSDANIDRFLVGADLLVEECDDLYMKVRLRERARELRMPVLMDTSDGGLLDIERFDREPARPPLHGLLSGFSAAELKGLTTKEKLPFVLSGIGIDRMSPAMAASLCEVKETISTWPQLGSSVVLGGALVADAARRIFLGELTGSGRFYVDLEQLVRDGAGAAIPAPEPLAVETVAEARRTPEPPATPAPHEGAATHDDVRFLVAHALMAPSGGNAQPWRFHWDGHALAISLDSERAGTFLDVDGSASWIALGAAAENVSLAATRLQRAAHIEPFPDPSAPLLACRVRLERASAAEPSPLAQQIFNRVTNRRLAAPRPLAADDADRLRAALTLDGARLAIVSDREAMMRVGEWLGRADRVRFLSPLMHSELVRELRWTPDEVARTRDGVDLATLDVSASDRAVLRVLSSASTMASLKRLGGGAALERPSRNAVAGASALALLTMPGLERRSWFEGGRQLQRVWLAATASGVALQPLGVLPFLLTRLDGDGLDADARAALAAIREPFRALFGVPERHAMILLVRLAYAEAPAARALRRSLGDVLTFGDHP